MVLTILRQFLGFQPEESRRLVPCGRPHALAIRYVKKCIAGRGTKPEDKSLAALAGLANHLAQDEERRRNSASSVLDGLNVGDVVRESAAEAGRAVADAAMEVVDKVVAGLLEW